MSVFSSPDFDRHENVVFGYDQDSGLRAIIAIHNSQLGPAMGGCRMYPYASEQDALRDVLRLSKGMSYKAALAGVALGGGKSVIIGDPRKDKSRQLFEAMGRFVDTLSGKYIAAQDMGINVQDLKQMATQSDYVSGISKRIDEFGQLRAGDPSPATALGVFCGIKAAVKNKLNRRELEGIRVAIQGLGHVGYHLARLLHGAGARLWLTDIDKAREADAIREFGAIAVSANELYSLEVDVFSPCAVGAILNDRTIASLRVKIIA
ncbi:MAG: Glu/Leu/Phe/Val dehydrogenase, partial [Proteobacteria bacterium]|nr:Glu/Leu/Phe/Val dehydrogenase [Pseudomonadota bacterium]